MLYSPSQKGHQESQTSACPPYPPRTPQIHPFRGRATVPTPWCTACTMFTKPSLPLMTTQAMATSLMHANCAWQTSAVVECKQGNHVTYMTILSKSDVTLQLNLPLRQKFPTFPPPPARTNPTRRHYQWYDDETILGNFTDNLKVELFAKIGQYAIIVR